MKIYMASRRFSVAKDTYFEVPEGTVFVYNGKYRIEMDKTRYPSVINLSKAKFNKIRLAGNGSLLEIEIDDKNIEQIFELNEERKRREEKIKNKLETMSRTLGINSGACSGS